jgi:hypothetical protein
MARQGSHRKPKAVRLLTATAAVVVAGGIVIGMGAASARTLRHPPDQEVGGVPQNGPFLNDFVDITRVPANVRLPRTRRDASTGTFVSDCGVNREGHNNPDNFIVTPGVQDGAQHVHDYVGNTTTDANSTDLTLPEGDTTCQNTDDRSAYFWPVLRVLGRGDGPDKNDDGGGADGNVGKILRPQSAKLEFRGNPTSPVVPMPPFLRVLYGNAKAISQQGKNAQASWTCTGFEDRLVAKYPLCPRGSSVERIHDFPSCWDGANTDSADHRSHIVYPRADGSCPVLFRPVPQLRVTLVYDVPQRTPFAVDGFPTEQHSPLTDHDDFVNVMSNGLMRQVAGCINSGRNCLNQADNDN